MPLHSAISVIAACAPAGEQGRSWGDRIACGCARSVGRAVPRRRSPPLRFWWHHGLEGAI